MNFCNIHRYQASSKSARPALYEPVLTADFLVV